MSDVRKPDARETALEVLMQVDSANRMVRRRPEAHHRQNKLDSRDAALATRLCYGVIQNRMLLDYYIGCWCSQRPSGWSPSSATSCVWGLPDPVFWIKVPPRAAVNEAVEMTKRHRRKKGGGYGQRHPAEICRQSGGYAAPAQGQPGADSLLRYSHPRWLVERLLSLIGEEETEAYLRMNNQVVPTTIQTNP